MEAVRTVGRLPSDPSIASSIGGAAADSLTADDWFTDAPLTYARVGTSAGRSQAMRLLTSSGAPKWSK